MRPMSRNASRTLLFDIRSARLGPRLCDVMDVPQRAAAGRVSSSGVVGETDPAWFGASIPIAGIAGDQQAATFGQACFRPGSAKNTYGTGAFMLQNTGDAPVASTHGLLTTVLWRLGDGWSGRLRARRVRVHRGGGRPVAARRLARHRCRGRRGGVWPPAPPASDGVYLVPAFVGLGAP